MHQRFSIYLADSAPAQQLHHHLRYKVYCERKGYESGSRTDTLAQEIDDYDSCAARFIVKDTVTTSWIGTARVIFNDAHPLPSQTLGAIDGFHAKMLERGPSAEVSRLATLCAYPSNQSRSDLLRSIIIGMLGHSYAHGVEWIVYLVTPGLARMLGRLGVPMQPCGEQITHRGYRRAFCSHVKSGIERTAWAQCILDGTLGYAPYSSLESVPQVRAA
jgi:N-acyl-L-homoserine lactone synthetase